MTFKLKKIMLLSWNFFYRFKIKIYLHYWMNNNFNEMHFSINGLITSNIIKLMKFRGILHSILCFIYINI